MTRKLQALLALLALLALVPALSGDNRKPEKTRDLMRKKLTNAQSILEGIAISDFDKITKGGEELIEISKKVEFQVHKTPRYEVRANEFRRAVEDLLEKAKEKNLDGATLSYMDMTLTCVKCHKYCREVRTTRRDDDEGSPSAFEQEP
jgi:hypothetical protein